MRPTRLRATLAALALGAAVTATTAATAGAADAAGPGPAAATTTPRLVDYYQTQYVGGTSTSWGTYVSPRPLARAGATDVVVGAFHVDDTGIDHLNDYPPSDPRFDRMWADLHTLQRQGVRVLGMVGGAAPGSFTRLDTQFDTYYPRLRDYITTYGLDGVDLDVEQPMSLAGMERLIDALRADFGRHFVITLAPVAPALSGGGNLSGFDYDALYASRGEQIDWFNTQFYCGWASLKSTKDYDAIIRRGVVPASKVVALTLTNPDNCGSGYVPTDTLTKTINKLQRSYPDFGGAGGWEYFNSLPGGTAQPWLWTEQVAAALR